MEGFQLEKRQEKKSKGPDGEGEHATGISFCPELSLTRDWRAIIRNDAFPSSDVYQT